MSVLPTPSEVLPEPSPIVGSAETFTAAAKFAEDMRARFQDAGREFTSASAALDRQESRHTIATSRRLRDTVISGCELAGVSADDGGRALGWHADEVTRIHREAHAVVSGVEEALGHLAAAAETLSETASELGCSIALCWHERAPIAPPASAAPSARAEAAGARAFLIEADRFGVLDSRWRVAAGVWNDAVESIEASVRRWQRLVDERTQAEHALIGRLDRTSLGALIREVESPVAQENAVSSVVAGYTSARPVAGSDSFEALLEGTLAPGAAARVWNEVVDGMSPSEVDDLIVEYSCELASIDGIPFWVMNRAARAALDWALENGLGERRRRMRLAEVAARMGFTPGEVDSRELHDQLAGIRRDVRQAERSGTGDVQLLALGRHDGVVTAAVSFGDLDRASRIGMLVSGMKSDVGGIDDSFKAFARIRERNPDVGMVTWVGYRSPELWEEPFQARAESGRLTLASFLDGLSATRKDEPPIRTVVVGHSYGSNTAAEALKLTREPVDAFFTMGSAGLKPGTSAEQLHARELYATLAAKDRIAPVGVSLHLSEPGPRVDPRQLDGVRVLSAEESRLGRGVTSHFLNPGQNSSADRAVGYLDPESSATRELTKILRGER